MINSWLHGGQGKWDNPGKRKMACNLTVSIGNLLEMWRDSLSSTNRLDILVNCFLSHRQYYLPRRVSSSGFPVPTPGRREDRKALRGCQVDVCVFLLFFNDSFEISDYGVGIMP